jgi:drug/metabolite transporter (DMT)-like permease
MKAVLAVALGILFSGVSVLSVLHGKAWEKSGSGWSWHLPVVFVLGGAAFVAQSYLSRAEASHVFVAFVDGVLVIGTLALLYLLYRERTSVTQWVGLGVVIVGLLLVTLGKPAPTPNPSVGE